jgi:hypothetical protein
MFIYVRGTGGGDKAYHWCRNCPKYPTLRIGEYTARRPTATLCRECENSEREGCCEE